MSNAELKKEARDWADAALPPEPWRFAHVSPRLADALEDAEAERDAALTVAERTHSYLSQFLNRPVPADMASAVLSAGETMMYALDILGETPRATR